MNKVFAKLNLYTQVQVLAFGVILTLVYYFLLYDDGQSIRAQIVTLTRQIEEETAKKAETEKVLEEEVRMKESVDLLSRQYQDLSRRLPTSLSSIDLNRNVDGFARQAGVSIKSRKPLPLEQGPIVEQVPIEISLEGTFAELAQFVYVISSAERVTALKDFTVAPLEKVGRLQFQGTVIGYQIATPPAEKTADPGAPAEGGTP